MIAMTIAHNVSTTGRYFSVFARTPMEIARAATFDRASTRFASNRGALQQLATMAARSGEDRRALKTWQRLHRLDPGNEVVIIGLGEAQFQAGSKSDARATWAELRERVHPPVHGHLRLAEVLLEHDLGNEAAAEAKRAQALDPKDVEPHRLLAQIFERAKKFNEAVDALRKK